jgi:hypothetical protein
MLKKDIEAWYEEKARWELEIGRARDMEKEAYERYEVPLRSWLECSGVSMLRVFLRMLSGGGARAHAQGEGSYGDGERD